METETVTISRAEYDELLAESALLNCLRNEGVGYWAGWDYAMEAYEEYLQSAYEEYLHSGDE